MLELRARKTGLAQGEVRAKRDRFRVEGLWLYGLRGDGSVHMFVYIYICIYILKGRMGMMLATI